MRPELSRVASSPGQPRLLAVGRTTTAAGEEEGSAGGRDDNVPLDGPARARGTKPEQDDDNVPRERARRSSGTKPWLDPRNDRRVPGASADPPHQPPLPL